VAVRRASAAVHDPAGRPWTSWLLDKGTIRIVHDAAGGPTEHRDDQDALDARGRVVAAYDEAGRLRTEGYDADGNLRSTVRRVLKPALLVSGLAAFGAWSGPAYVVEWQPATGVDDGGSGHCDARRDRLRRGLDLRRPQASHRHHRAHRRHSQRAQIAFSYGRGGGVTRLTVAGVPHLQLTDRVLIFRERHLRRVLAEYAAHYNRQRPHRALQLRPPRPESPIPEPFHGRVRRREVLGGLINEYKPAA
jgi:YD repeat-containing protein